MNTYIASPKLKTEEWDLVLAQNSGVAQVNDLALKRLEIDLLSIISKSADPIVKSNAYDYLGRMWAIKGDAGKVAEMYRNGVRIYPSVAIRLNYAISLQIVGDLVALKTQSDNLFGEFYGNPGVLCFLIKAYITLSDYIGIAMVEDKLIKLNALESLDPGILSSGLFDHARNFSERAKQMGVSRQDIENRFLVAIDALKGIGYYPKTTGICSPESCETASIRFVIDDSPERMAEASFAIADAIVSKFEDPMDDLFTFSVMSPRN